MRKRVLAMALMSALVMLSACSSSTPAPGTKPSSPAPFASYVALGDSYASGPLIAPEAKGSPPQCLRSGGNYPSYLAFYLRVRSFTDVSCGGATTASLTSPQGGQAGGFAGTRVPPQLDALKKSTDLVTLGIGGNDFGLFANLIYGSSGRQDSARQLASAAAIQPLVESAIKEIRVRSPHARIVIIGYLRVFPATGSCASLPFAATDRAQADAIERRINQSLAQAAKAQGAGFVDSYALGTGHDICAGKNAWVNGSSNIFFIAAAYHPFRAGMDGVARGAYKTVTGSPAPKEPTLKQLAAIPR